MADASIVADIHAELDGLYAWEALPRWEPESLGWPQAKRILGAAIALDPSGGVARRILLHRAVDLRVVAEAVLAHAHDGSTAAADDSAYRVRWDTATVVVHYCRTPTDVHHRAALSLTKQCRAVLNDQTFTAALTEAIDTRRDHQ